MSGELKEMKGDFTRQRTSEGTQEVEKYNCTEVDHFEKREKEVLVLSANQSEVASQEQESQEYDPFTVVDPKPREAPQQARVIPTCGIYFLDGPFLFPGPSGQ